MPSEERTNIIQFQGGLDTTSGISRLFGKPGSAVNIVNFESGLRGGYRKINGYDKYSLSSPDGVGTDPVVASITYNDGCVAVQGGNVFFTFDGTTWVQVNKDTGGEYVDLATLNTLPTLTRNTSNDEHYYFTEYNNGVVFEIFMVDSLGTNPISRFVVDDTLGTVQYKYEELREGSWGVNNTRFPTAITIHKERLVASADLEYKNELYYSNLGSVDITDFIGGGVINVADEVVRCESFRENLIVFNKNSIDGIAGLGDPARQNVENISRHIGCIAPGSVQGLSGGLIFLAYDGLRTVSTTQRLDDFELGTITGNIQPTILEMVKGKEHTHEIVSCNIKDKNQYRLYVTNESTRYNGLLAVFRQPLTSITDEGIEWSLLQGNPIHDVFNSWDRQSVETIYQVIKGSGSEFVYNHDSGSTFDGSKITAVYQTPYIMLDDPNTRKTLHYLDFYLDVENDLKFAFQILYDTALKLSPDTPVLSVNDAAYYGLDIYDSGAVYSEKGVGNSIERVPVQGSGKLFSLLIISDDADPFTLDAVNISYFLNGRF